MSFVSPFRSFPAALAFVASVALAGPALAQSDDDDSASVQVQGGFPGMPGFDMSVRVNEGKRGTTVTTGTSTRREEYSSNTPGQSFRVVYEETENGGSRFKILSPEGFRVRVTDGSAFPVLNDTMPAALDALANKYYRFEVFGPQGVVVFDKKFEAKTGMLGTIWVNAGSAPPATVVQVQVQAPPPMPAAPPPAAAPASCQSSSDLAEVKEAIENEGFSKEKLDVLESAAPDRWFCVAQVVEVLELYAFSADKIAALKIMKPRIADPQNKFKIINALDFSSDKDAAKKILQ